MDPAEIPAALAEFLGPEKYNEFLDALEGSARPAGRLVFWQERAWQKLTAARELDIPVTFEAVYPLLQGQPPAQVPLPREEFLILNVEFPPRSLRCLA